MNLGPWLRMFLPPALLALAVILGYSHVQSKGEHDLKLSGEYTMLDLAEERLSQQLQDAVHDLRVIANTPAIKEFIENSDSEWRNAAELLMAAFAGQKWEYKQIRLLDANGREQIRVDRTAEGPQVVRGLNLQDKSHRDYFRKAISLRPGVTAPTPFDLNIEFGVVERPINPTLRLAMHLRSTKGAIYVLVANLRANVLLQGIRSVLNSGNGEAWMLSDDGYWIIHPEPAKEWGAQLDPRNQLQRLHPELIPYLGQGREPVEVKGREYIFKRIRPLAKMQDEGQVEQSQVFDLIVSNPSMSNSLALDRYLAGLLVMILSALAIICAVIVTVRERAASAEEQRARLEERNAAESKERAWIREHTYELSLKLSATDSLQELGEVALRELAPTLDLVAACLYIVQARRAKLIAGFGLLDIDIAREFGLGEGLIGEVARTSIARRMTPPPPDYLDVAGGLGPAPATDLRVLPLEIHGRCIGVLELAFSGLLSDTEEEFLMETLPLLALNLDGFHRTRRAVA